MPTDQHPIPREALPPGWGPAEHCDETVAYRRSRPPVELIAARTEAEHSHPTLGLERCWELRYCYSLGELSVAESIGHVVTRRAALRGLLECMHRVHERVDDLEDPIEVQAVLESVRLEDFVPDGTAMR